MDIRTQFELDAINTIKTLRNTLLDIQVVLPLPEITEALRKVQEFGVKYSPKSPK